MTRLAGPLSSSPTLEPIAATDDPSPPARKVYNRSSFEGDFLLVIPDQTAEDFEQFAPESQICEYFDGTIYMPSPVADRHQDLVGFFFDLLNGMRWTGRRPLHVLMGPAVLRLDGETKPEPDVFVRPLDRPQGPALLVIEVISPSHKAYDLEFKAAKYREAGLAEVWYIDDSTKHLYRDIPRGDVYEREILGGGRLAATQIPGFWNDVAWLWSAPLPDPRQCLLAILAAPPA